MKNLKYKLLLFSLVVPLIIITMWVVLPRMWSAINPAKAPVGYYWMPPAYLALWTGLETLADLKPEVPEEIKCFTDIEYKNAGGKSLKLNIYKPDNIVDPVPLLVFIHGGGWRSGNREDYLVYLVDFAKRGYVTATVSYRLVADSPYPACIEDINDAVQWFFGHSGEYGYDPDRIALIGGSAGAHLAMLAGYGWNSHDNIDSTSVRHRAKAVVDIYGPADLTTEYARNHELVTTFIARSYDESPELYIEASPVNYLDKYDPATLILHGTCDRLVPISQSDDLKARLDKLGVPCSYYKLPGWPHTMDVVKRVNDYCQTRMSEFFDQYLK